MKGIPHLKDTLLAGLQVTKKIKINRERTIGFMGENGRVYGTPSMVEDIEYTCHELIQSHLDENEKIRLESYLLQKLAIYSRGYTIAAASAYGQPTQHLKDRIKMVQIDKTFIKRTKFKYIGHYVYTTHRSRS